MINVVSAKMVQPLTGAGPTVELTLQNQWGCPVTSLSAILELYKNYTYYFNDVNSSHPLGQGQTVTANQTLFEGEFDSTVSYPLVIEGTIQDTLFTETVMIQILPV
jgi:hypothetical protein